MMVPKMILWRDSGVDTLIKRQFDGNDICYRTVFSGIATLSVISCILMPALELFVVGNDFCNCYFVYKKVLLEC